MKAWISWKATDVHMETSCEQCQTPFEVFGHFAYFVECPDCGAKYEVGQYVELTKINTEPPIKIVGKSK